MKDPVVEMFRDMWSNFTRESKMRMPLWSVQHLRKKIADRWGEEAYQAELAGNPQRAAYISYMAFRIEQGTL